MRCVCGNRINSQELEVKQVAWDIIGVYRVNFDNRRRCIQTSVECPSLTQYKSVIVYYNVVSANNTQLYAGGCTFLM